MLVVLDTNVIVSAALSQRSSPAEIVRRWHAKMFEVATSSPQLIEIERAFTYPKIQNILKLSPEEFQTFLHSFRQIAIVVEPTVKLSVISEDPDDNHILECAVSAQAQYIVSGDFHLTKLESYEGIRILSPYQFLTVLDLEK